MQRAVIALVTGCVLAALTAGSVSAQYAAILVGMCGFVLDHTLLWLRRRLVHWEREPVA